MSVMATYDAQLSRVRLSGSLATLSVPFPTFETSHANWSASSATVARVTEQAHGGSYSLRVTPSNGSTWPGVFVNADNAAAVTPGERVQWALWVRSNTGHATTVSMNWLDAANAAVDLVSAGFSVTAATWTRLVVEGTVPEGAVKAQGVVAATGSANAVDIFYVDDVELNVVGALVERSTDQVTWSRVRGGYPVTVSAGAWSLDDYEFEPGVANYYRVRGETASVTPVIGDVWLKSVARPWLNRPVQVVDFSSVQRAARAGVFDVIGRSLPVTVSDVRGGRGFTLEVVTETPSEADDFDVLLASGDPVLLQVPPGSMVPAGYFTVGDTNCRRAGRESLRRVFELPLAETTAPGPDVIGSSSTYQTVVNTYATYADLLAAHATYASIPELIGSGEDVITP